MQRLSAHQQGGPPDGSGPGDSLVRQRVDSSHCFNQHQNRHTSSLSSPSFSSTSVPRASLRLVVSVLLVALLASSSICAVSASEASVTESHATSTAASTVTASKSKAEGVTAPSDSITPLTIPVRHSVVIEHEAELPLDYSEHIHPYAWEHRRPDPYFLPHHTAYNIATEKELPSFLEVQTHLKARSKEASRLKRIHFGGPWVPPDTKDVVNPKGFSAKMGLPPPKNPASIKTENDDEIPSDFIMDPEMTRNSNRYRRAVYGLRRRRMPYWGVTAPFGSTNPYHRQNGFFSAPSDFLVSKPPNPLLAVRDPHVFDFGRMRGRETLLPYGGYSSFSGQGGGAGGGGAGFHSRPNFAFRGGWHAPTGDWTGAGYSGDGPRGVHDGLNNFYASPYTSYNGGGPGFGGGGFGRGGPGGAVPNFIPGDTTFFNFYDGLFGGGGGGGESSGSSSG